MPHPSKPFITPRRSDSKTFQISLNSSSGLPERVCLKWKRKSFQDLPPELDQFRNPKTRAAAEAGAIALIQFLKKANDPIAPTKDIFVGVWLKKFTIMEESPRGARNIAKNRPYSIDTMNRYEGLYRVHIKDDPLMKLKMSEVSTTDALELVTRIAQRDMVRKDLKGKYKLVGTETFDKIIKFVRMAFKEYRKMNPGWYNAFQDIDPPHSIEHKSRDALSEDEVVMLYGDGVLRDTMEVAVCSAMFLAGMRRSEIFALKPEDLDWHTPKIMVCRAWQKFNYKERQIGPTKGKKERKAPFDSVLQDAITKLWEENGKHEFVFSFKDGKTPGPSWTKGRFKKWLNRAGIELNGRKIVPHSSRHSLASLLEERGSSLRYIQELLGHSDLKTTKSYLHSTDKTIRDIGKKIDDAIRPEELPDNILRFVASR